MKYIIVFLFYFGQTSALLYDLYHGQLLAETDIANDVF